MTREDAVLAMAGLTARRLAEADAGALNSCEVGVLRRCARELRAALAEEPRSPAAPPEETRRNSDSEANEGDEAADAAVAMGAALHGADVEIARLREAMGRITGMETISEARGAAAAVLLAGPSPARRMRWG